MFKRIVTGILSVIFAGALLCGCTFFSHDYEADLKQVAAHIDSYEIQTSAKEEAYKTKPVDIYKYDLYQYVSNNASTLQQSYSDLESMYKYSMNMLVNLELVTNEVDALIDAGEIEWGMEEINAVRKNSYNTVDSTLRRIKNEILEERDRPTINYSGDGEISTETTYPVKPTEENDDDDDDKPEPEKWEPSISRYPGLSGDDEAQSLDRQAMLRFINLLKDNVKDDFRVTDEDRKLFEQDDARINEIIDNEGISYVYREIVDTHYFYYLTRKNIERSQKITAMQEYLTDSVTVSDEEVQKSYISTLNEQKSSYTANVANFDTAMSGSTTVLYYPNSDYFYVKHILLPFSDEQKSALTEYKERINVTEEQVTAFRANLAESIVCYPHENGEDDKSRPMSVKEVIADIRSKMLPLESNVVNADRMFDDLIYLYNTDPGAFGNNKGYAVKDADEGNNYMEEFTDGARYMRANLAVGQVYYEPVITDYGVHIMYFASTTAPGQVAINDYTTPGKLETYYDLLSEPIKTARENAAYTKWENEKITYNFNKFVTLFEDRYKSLWED